MEPGLWLVLIGILICSAMAAFFAMAEGALFALGRGQAGQIGQGRLTSRLLEDQTSLLASLLLGSTIADFGVLFFALWPVLNGVWPWFSTALVLIALFLVNEVVPKVIGAREPEKWSLRLSPAVTGFHLVSGLIYQPITRAVQALLRLGTPKSINPQYGLSDEEYKELLELAHEQGALARSEKDIILQIINLDRKAAGMVMKPRSQIVAVSDDDTVEDMIGAARKHKFRHLPVYDETLDTIVGILNTRKLLLDPQIDLAEVIDFPSNVPETMNLLQLLKSLQRQQRRIAIVLDEFGGTAGLITIEDILEEVVGEIGGADQSQPYSIEKLGDGRWKVSGATPLEKFRAECAEIGEGHGVETVGGLVVKLFEVVPNAGQSIAFKNLRLTAQHTDERRVREVLVEVVRKK